MKAGFSAYPILLTCLARVQSVVIGGGVVGERKVAGLLQANANIRLISPQATPQLRKWAEAGRIAWVKRSYQPGDLADAWLVIVATDQRTVNRQAAQEAQRRGLLCNVVDAPAEGNFHVPALYRSEEAIVAVSTCAGDPTQALALRDRIRESLQKGDHNHRSRHYVAGSDCDRRGGSAPR